MNHARPTTHAMAFNLLPLRRDDQKQSMPTTSNSPVPEPIHPTRRSLRESNSRTTVSASPKQPRSHKVHPTRAATPQRGMAGRLTARVATFLVVPALFGTMALPAFASPDPTTAANIVGATDAQSLIVGSNVTASTIQRDSYSATTQQELRSPGPSSSPPP